MDTEAQDDLTGFDHLAVETESVFPADDAIPQPLQDPSLIPATTVDEYGNPS